MILGTAFAMVLTGSVKAQTVAAQPAQPIRIMFINTLAFEDPKDGIKKMINANTLLDAEFKPVRAELETMGTKWQNLGDEIDRLQKSTVPVNKQALQKMAEDRQLLETQIKRKTEDAKINYEKRQQSVVGPVVEDVYKTIQEFAKSKGYTVILDAAKLDQGGLLLAWDEKADVTKDFVTYYNTRQSTATAVPKP